MSNGRRRKGDKRKGKKTTTSYASNSVSDPNFSAPHSMVMQPSSAISLRYVQHQFIRYGNTVTVQGNAATVFGAITWAISSMQNSINLYQLYDQARIDKVEVHWTLKSMGTSALFPRLLIYPDWDDGAPPTTVAQVQTHPRLQEHVFSPSNTDFSIALSPRVALGTFNGAFNGYSQPNGPQWIDTANQSVLHYGAKYAVTNFTDTTASIEFTTKFWVTMRNPH